MHIEVVPSIKPITAIDPLSVIYGGHVVPSFPTELIAAPLNTVGMSCDCSWADENFVGVIGILKHLVVPEIIIPIRTGNVAWVTRAVSVAGVVAFVIGGPHKKSILHLFQVVFALHFVGFPFGFGKGGEQHRRQDTDDGNDH